MPAGLGAGWLPPVVPNPGKPEQEERLGGPRSPRGAEGSLCRTGMKDHPLSPHPSLVTPSSRSLSSRGAGVTSPVPCADPGSGGRWDGPAAPQGPGMPAPLWCGTAWHGTARHDMSPRVTAPHPASLAGSGRREVPTQLCFSSQLKEKERDKEGKESPVGSGSARRRWGSQRPGPHPAAGLAAARSGQWHRHSGMEKELEENHPAVAPERGRRAQSGLAKGHATAAAQTRPDSCQQCISRYPDVLVS